MDIEDFLPSYPDITDEEFYRVIADNKEFKLGPYESKPEKPGDLMLHQKFMKRFLSPHTTYDKMLLFHSPGVGKTCSAIAVAESFKALSYRPLIIVKGPKIKSNWIREIARTCTSGKYLPNEIGLTGELEQRRINALVKLDYDIVTYEVFVTNIKNMKREDVKRGFDRRVIIIDEVHNLRIQDEKDKKKKGASDGSLYKTIHRFLHYLSDSKVLILSATPMFDKPSEIASTMNL